MSLSPVFHLRPPLPLYFFFFFNDPATPEIYTLSLHDALPISYVVVDEAHVYRGVFGSHVGNVLRRLRRLAGVYGAEPQLLLASATIANPGELATSLAGVEANVVDNDTAPRAERTVVLWNPELIDAELGLRASALGDASRLLAALFSPVLRTIC